MGLSNFKIKTYFIRIFLKIFSQNSDNIVNNIINYKGSKMSLFTNRYHVYPTIVQIFPFKTHFYISLWKGYHLRLILPSSPSVLIFVQMQNPFGNAWHFALHKCRSEVIGYKLKEDRHSFVYISTELKFQESLFF